MNKAFVFRIYPNKEQRILLAKTFGCARFIWNKMLSDKKDWQGSKESCLNVKKEAGIEPNNEKQLQNSTKRYRTRKKIFSTNRAGR